MEDAAKCRGCGKTLEGKPYHTGGPAWLPNGRRAPSCFYGGWVCSRECDVRACLDLERTMPGHSYNQTRLLPETSRRTHAKWDALERGQ